LIFFEHCQKISTANAQMDFPQISNVKVYIFVKFIGFLSVSCIQGCFHWLSQSDQELWLIKGLLVTTVAGMGVKGLKSKSFFVATSQLII